MLRVVLVALVIAEIVLLTVLMQAPTNAASSNYENYMWSFATVGSNQVVCKKMVIHPKQQKLSHPSKSVPVDIASGIVDDSYCSPLAKPLAQQ